MNENLEPPCYCDETTSASQCPKHRDGEDLCYCDETSARNCPAHADCECCSTVDGMTPLDELMEAKKRIDELEAVIRSFNNARKAAQECPDLLLSDHCSQKAVDLMWDLTKAEKALEEAVYTIPEIDRDPDALMRAEIDLLKEQGEH